MKNVWNKHIFIIYNVFNTLLMLVSHRQVQFIINVKENIVDILFMHYILVFNLLTSPLCDFATVTLTGS